MHESQSSLADGSKHVITGGEEKRTDDVMPREERGERADHDGCSVSGGVSMAYGVSKMSRPLRKIGECVSRGHFSLG